MNILENFENYIINEKRYSKFTLRAYSDDLLQFKNFCLNELSIIDLTLVKSKDIRLFIVYSLDSGLSENSMNRKLSTLKSFYKYLLKEGLIENSPLDQIKRLKKKSKLPEFLTEDQLNKLFDQVQFPNDFTGIRDKLIIEMIYDTGIRVSELINLTNQNLDTEAKTIKVLGKRNKERIIPYPETLNLTIFNYQKLLKEHLSGWESPYFFLSSKGNKLYPELVYRVVRKYLSIITSMSKRSPHVLRHTFATHLLNNGADLNAIKELLGHANLAATQVYTHNSFEKLNSIYKQAHPRA